MKISKFIKSNVLNLVASLAMVSCIENDLPYPDIQANFTNIIAEHQYQKAAIDSINRTVTLYLNDSADITNVNITEYTLSEGATLVTPMEISGGIDLSQPLNVTLKLYREYNWVISAYQSTTKGVNAWSKVAWVYGSAEEGKDNGVEYRKASENTWTKVPANWITHNGGDFTARIIHLEPETKYFARTYSNNEYGEEVEFTTGSIVQVPNSNFDNWWQDGSTWCPWSENDPTPFWGTGNKGTSILKTSISIPTDETATGNGSAAKLETRIILTRLAAGNIFTGEYIKNDGLNGILDFGRKFSHRPTKLKGYYKYDCKTINKTNSKLEVMENMIGQPDTCSIWIALTDWDGPFQIRTNPENQQLFDENAPYVIAYGRFQSGETNKAYPNYETFEIELNYNDIQRVPKYIVIAASASKYGDFFTGGEGSTLYVDEFELVYDYDDDDPIKIGK